MDERNHLEQHAEQVQQPSDAAPAQEEAAAHSGPPPVNPWNNALSLIAWGYVLRTVKLNFLLLNLILPIAADLMVATGTRQLSGENEWYARAWRQALLLMAVHTVGLALQGTSLAQSWLGTLVGLVALAIELGYLWMLRRAVQETFVRTGREQHSDPLKWLMLCLVLFSAIGLLKILDNTVFALFALLVYYTLFYRLGTLFRGMEDEALPEPLADGITNDRLAVLYIGTCVVLVTAGCVLGNRPWLRERPLPVVTATAARSHLLELGAPEKVLRDVDDDDLQLLGSAVRVRSFEEALQFGSQEAMFAGRHVMQVCTVFIELPGMEVAVLHHLSWRDGGLFWQDGLDAVGIQPAEVLSGQLLYEKDGRPRAAAIPRLSSATDSVQDWFGAHQSNRVAGAFGYPLGAQNRRATLLYRMQLQDNDYSCPILLNYLHMEHPFRWPYTKSEALLSQGWFSFENCRQHITHFDTIAHDRLVGELEEIE